MTAPPSPSERPTELPIAERPGGPEPVLTGAAVCGICQFAKGESSSRAPASWIWAHRREDRCGWVAVCRFCRTRTEPADRICDLSKPAAQH